jgi:hypothetical protein
MDRRNSIDVDGRLDDARRERSVTTSRTAALEFSISDFRSSVLGRRAPGAQGTTHAEGVLQMPLTRMPCIGLVRYCVAVGQDEQAHSVAGDAERKCPVRGRRARRNEGVDSD